MMAFLMDHPLATEYNFDGRLASETQIISGLTRYVDGFLLLCCKGSNMEFNLTSMLFIYVLFKKNMPL